MSLLLDDVERRVLGALIEKDMSTPEYYPLSMNALVLACNQKNNREPVSEYDEGEVTAAIARLRDKRLAVEITGAGMRVPKYAHRAQETWNLGNRELALLAVLLLRGPQTVNELKDRTHRLHAFDDHDAVENGLRKLAERQPESFAVFLPRQPGQREPRWMHLLAGPVDAAALAEAGLGTEGRGGAEVRSGLGERVAALEKEVAELRAALQELKEKLGE